MKLVIGASGFLGSRVTRKLVQRGEDVRVMVRETSSTRGIDDLDVGRCYGDVFDRDALRAAMEGCDVIFYCVVDSRAWLRDPTPMYRTNVEGLQNVLDVALAAGVKRFVFLSTIATLAVRSDGKPVTEDDPFNWTDAGAYTNYRRKAEQLVLRYAQEKHLPAIALCVSNTYGPGDWQPTPHGSLLAAVAAGKAPFYFRGLCHEVVGIDDAAEAMVLAMDNGRVGERYIISDRYISSHELHALAADAAGVKRPWLGIPLGVALALGSMNQELGRIVRRDFKFVRRALTMWDAMSELDHSKAQRELGWQPQPFEQSVQGAVEFFRAHGLA